MRKKTSQTMCGFTLIELLVVIAIIGILATIVLSSLGSARTKAADTKVKATLSGMRSQALLYSGANGAFPLGTCAITAGTLFGGTPADLAAYSLGAFPEVPPPATSLCVVGGPSSLLPAGGETWAIAWPLSSGAFCVDSTGAARMANSTGTLYVTPADALPSGANVCA